MDHKLAQSSGNVARTSAQQQSLEIGKPAHWSPTSDGSNCSDCKSKFGFVNRKNHCRMCGFLVCGTCLNSTVTFPSLEQAVKVCAGCKAAFDAYEPKTTTLHVQQEQRKNNSPAMLRPLAKAAWVPNSQATACMVASCAVPFNLSVRRHHCRFCAMVACDSCTSNRTRIDKDMLRTCAVCFEQQIAAGADGSGTVTSKEGLMKGNFVQGLLEGDGRCTASDGSVYTGMFKRGKRHGNGVFNSPIGEHYSGHWENNLRHGVADCSWKHGLWKHFKGRYENDRWSGAGELTYHSGDVFVGIFKEGLLSGKGMYRYSSGLTFGGIFENNVPVEGKLTFPSTVESPSLSSVLSQLPMLPPKVAGRDTNTRVLSRATPAKASLSLADHGDYFEGFLHGQNVAEGQFWSKARQAKFLGTFLSDWRNLPQHEGLTKGTVTTDDKQFTYTGELSNWLPHGEGVLKLSDSQYQGHFFAGTYCGWGCLTRTVDGKEVSTHYCFGPGGEKYGGEMKDSKPHGKGIRYYPDWTVEYSGEWAQGLRTGFGMSRSAAAIYEGFWEKDQKCGQGTQTFASGDRYKGEWRDDRMNGVGQYHFQNGDIYEGMWKDGERQGRGIFTFSKGPLKSVQGEWVKSRLDTAKEAVVTWVNTDSYEGDVNGSYLPNGFGSLKLVNGDVYQGEFANGSRSKWGKLIRADGTVTHHCYYPNGMRYEGQMTDRKPWGRGTNYFANQTIQYAGDWKDGQKHGKGSELFVNGDKYEGEFIEDEAAGLGVMTYINGEKFSGHWKGGQRFGRGTLFFAAGPLRLVTGEWRGLRLALETVCELQWNSGETYEGLVNQAYQRHGKGVYTMTAGHRYDGGWENDEKRGWGCYTSSDGLSIHHCYYSTGGRYEGGMQDFKPHGRGVRTFPDGTVEFTGEWNLGLRHGHGINHYTTGDSYEGDWVNDCRSGYGTHCFANGDRYEGNWLADVRNGRGRFFPFLGEVKCIEGEWRGEELILESKAIVTWTSGDSFEGVVNAKYQPNGLGVQRLANGDRYNGEWVDGVRVNCGSHIRTGTSTTTYHCYWSNGSWYEGEMKNWLPSGHGTQYSAKGNVEYEGEWRENKRCGHGLSFNADGSRYDGIWLNDKHHGEGTFVWANGDKYVGEWACGERHGSGQLFPSGGDILSVNGEWNDSLRVDAVATLTWRTGDVFVGHVNSAYQPDGMGTYRFSSGDVYTGEFKNGARRSWGELTKANSNTSVHHCYWGNGERYEGEMKDREPHGYGVKYYSKYYMTGNIEYEGEWQNGKPHGRGTKYYSNEKYEGEWEHGKRKGKGTQWLNKEHYYGDWLDDERTGVGTLYFSEDNVLKSVCGEWKHSALFLNTIAVVHWNNGEMFEGFVNAEYQPHGRGFLVSFNGHRTDGEWQAGVNVAWSRNIRPEPGEKHLFTCQFYTGERYKGEMKDGLLHGMGTKNYLSGDVYTGEWVNDLRHGRGVYLFANGDRYEGGWEDDVKSGQGTKSFTNGDRYEGNWAHDEQSGKGIFHRAQGQLRSIQGQWQGSRLLIEHSVELTWRAGEQYEGALNASYQPHGFGTQKLVNGDRYEGSWFEGQRRYWGRYLHSGSETHHYFWPGGARYEGGKLNDEFSGKGTKYYANGGVEYEGEWQHNLRHGFGTHHAPNGEQYEGLWVQDMRSGQGKMTYTNGDRYEGMWLANDRQGHGTFYWKTGERLSVTGEWDNISLAREGRATVVWRSGDSYTGELNAAYKPHGQGVLTLENGTQYIGDWEDGLRRNWGRLVSGGQTVHHYYWPNGERYEGQMEDFMRSGFGKQFYSDGSRYEGSWAADQRSGEGTMFYANGDKYEGGWVADEKCGQGKYSSKDELPGGAHAGGPQGAIGGGGGLQGTLPGAVSWEGRWESDRKSGPGELTFANGLKRNGIWENDERKSPFRVGQLVSASLRVSNKPSKHVVRVCKIFMDFKCNVKIVRVDGEVSVPYIVDERDMEAQEEATKA